MALTRSALAAAVVALAPGWASAALMEYTYVFTGAPVTCGAPGTGLAALRPCESPTVTTADNPYPLHIDDQPIPAELPSFVSATGEGLGDNPNPPPQQITGPAGVSVFSSGLGVGGVIGGAGALTEDAGNLIGSLEQLIIEFGSSVTVVGFGISAFNGGGPTSGQMEFIPLGGISRTRDYTGGDQSFTVLPVESTTFTFTNVTPTGDVPEGESPTTGFRLASITVQYETDMEVIPVPPAMPLLGGALGLLWWRARRAKKAA